MQLSRVSNDANFSAGVGTLSKEASGSRTALLTYGFLFRDPRRRRRRSGRRPRRSRRPAHRTCPRRLHVGRHLAQIPPSPSVRPWFVRPLSQSVSEAAVMKGAFMTRAEKEGKVRHCTAH